MIDASDGWEVFGVVFTIIGLLLIAFGVVALIQHLHWRRKH